MAKIKELWCMCHSHLDIGYTHPQPMLMELQGDFIEQAIALCEKTEDYPEESRFRWTCEATYPVMKWLEHAEQEKIDKFHRFVAEGRISVAALPMHTTPGATLGKMVTMARDIDEVREKTGAPLDFAINHDINGQPWTMAPILMDSHVNFYMTGINIHFGGIPFPRPAAFWWEAPDGRRILTYEGEHYSLFSQFLYTYEKSTERMDEGLREYAERLERQGHKWDIAFLTATNPPMFDNNCPDWDLPDMVRKYNEENHDYKIRFVTPEMLREYLRNMGDSLPVYKGDWNDYWNFGSGSAAREGRVNRLAQRALETAGVLSCFNGGEDKRTKAIRKEAELKGLIYEEHTWGASQAMSDPHDYESQSQYIHKIKNAYEAADLSGYLVAKEVEKLEGNPYQCHKIEGLSVVNPTGVTQNVELNIPVDWMKEERQLSGARAKRYIPYIMEMTEKPYYAHEERKFFGCVQVPPFSYKVIPFETLENYKKEPSKGFKREEGILETPYYTLYFSEVTGRIFQIYSKKQEENILDEKSPWTFFELVRETVDSRFQKEARSSIFPRNVDLGNRNISQWNHDWKAKRCGASDITEWNLEIKEDRAVLTWKIEMPGTKWAEQSVEFYSDREEIDMKLKLHKLPVETPESFYLAFPLKLEEGWECVYNTAGQYTALDKEQLGHVCRDWVTVDNGAVMYDSHVCYGLASSEAPLLQIGDFNFGREDSEIERKENPLLLAWPLNNYWDTNFVAAQSDVMEFSYRFYCKESFDRTEMYREFLREEKRGLIGAAVHAEEKVKTLIKASEEGIISRVYPAKDGENWIFQMKNQEKEEKRLTVEIPLWKTFSWCSVDMQEKEKGQWSKAGMQAEIKLAPQELLLVKVKREN